MPLDRPKVCPGEEWSRGRPLVMCGRMPLSLSAYLYLVCGITEGGRWDGPSASLSQGGMAPGRASEDVSMPLGGGGRGYRVRNALVYPPCDEFGRGWLRSPTVGGRKCECVSGGTGCNALVAGPLALSVPGKSRTPRPVGTCVVATLGWSPGVVRRVPTGERGSVPGGRGATHANPRGIGHR